MTLVNVVGAFIRPRSPRFQTPKCVHMGGQTVMAKLVGRYTTSVPTVKSVGPNLTKRSAVTRRRGLLLHMGLHYQKVTRQQKERQETILTSHH